MTLDDFERSLAQEKQARDADESSNVHSESRKRRKKNHHHHRHHHRRRHDEEDSQGHRQSEHSKQSLGDYAEQKTGWDHGDANEGEEADKWVEKTNPTIHESAVGSLNTSNAQDELKRDAWMEDPSAIDIDYIQKKVKDPPKPATMTSSKADFELKIHDNELNKHHLQNLADGRDLPDEVTRESAQHTVDYTFGDGGSQWRMTKLKAVYRRAKEGAVDVNNVAMEQYGDLRFFDDAREEEMELERRETYGEGYIGKEKPSRELFQQRKLEMGVHSDQNHSSPVRIEEQSEPRILDTEPSLQMRLVDQTTLNRLKAQMMKAKLRGSSDASKLETEYTRALGLFEKSSNPGTVILGAMDNRMLAGGQRGEVKAIETKRGRERGLVEENEDMSIDDMVRQERRTRNQIGGDSQRFAETIAKDAKFDVSPQNYMVKAIANNGSRTIWNTWMKMLRNSPSVSRNPRLI